MKKSLQEQNRPGSENNAQGQRALQQLEDAARKLAQGQEAGLSQGVERAVNESKKLVDEQNKIQEGLERLLKDNPQTASSDKAKQRQEDLISRKKALADRVKNLGNQAQDLSKQARKTQKEAGRKLADAAGTIQENSLPERIMSGNALIQNGLYENQKPREELIRNALEEVNRQLKAAQNGMGQTKDGKMEEAANRARQLAEGLESMQQRMRSAQEMQSQGDRAGRQSASRGQEGQQPGQQPGQRSGQQPGQRSGQQSGQQPGQQAGQQQGQPPGRGMDQNAQQDARGLRGQTPQDRLGGRPGSATDLQGPTTNSLGPPTGIGTPRSEEERQRSREFQQRLMDAQELRGLLDRNSGQMENLDKAIESLRRANSGYDNPEQIARLKAAIDYMRKVELNLTRALENQDQRDKYFLTEDNKAPNTYKKLVDEYFKSLAKNK
jgi:hypothetical protein